jgi:aminoglycoside phosphotransferase (APT) family kinase protein
VIERYSWDSLPDAVRLAVWQKLGPTTVIRDVEQGQNCNLALVLRTDDDGDVFLKGVRGISPRMRWLRNEAEAGVLAPGIAPAARSSADVDTDEPWFVVGFEYVNGRPADLSPDSDDLGIVSATLTQLSAFPGGASQPLAKRWGVSDWWTKLAAEDASKAQGWDLDEMTEWCQATPELVDGSALLHTDLHEHQFMIDDATTSVRVIDWGRPASGAAWVDTAFLVIRLIAAGHTPELAETWATTVPAWSRRTDKGVTAFACYVAGLWGYRAATTPFPGATRLGDAARTYAQYRLRDVRSPVQPR